MSRFAILIVLSSLCCTVAYAAECPGSFNNNQNNFRYSTGLVLNF